MTIMSAFFIVAFKFDLKISWLWTGNEIIPLIFGIFTIFFAALWYLESRKLKK